MSKVTVRLISHSRDLEQFVHYCETTCVAGCCGLDACEFTKANVDRWLLECPGDRDRVLKELSDLLREIEAQAEAIVSSDLFGTIWKKSEALAFFKELRTLLAENS